MAVYTEVTDEELSAFLGTYDIGTVLSCKGIAEGVENTNYFLHTSGGSFILTLYEKRVREADLPFFLGLMEHLAGRGLTCPQPVRNRSGQRARPPRRAAGGDHQLPRGLVGPPPDGPPLRRVGRGPGAAPSRRPRFPDAAAERLVPERLAAAVRGGGRATPTASRRASPSAPGASSTPWPSAGRRGCRAASSMPISSPTTCSSSATPFPA